MGETVCQFGPQVEAGMLFKFLQTQLRLRRDHQLVVRIDEGGVIVLHDEGAAVPETMDRGTAEPEPDAGRMFPCDVPGCHRVLSSTGNRARHRAMVHGIYTNRQKQPTTVPPKPRAARVKVGERIPYLECVTCGFQVEVHYGKHNNPGHDLAVHTLKEHRRGPTRDERQPKGGPNDRDDA